MYKLRFFHADDPMIAFKIADGTARFIDDYVREGEFTTFVQAVDRMNNIGSRWIFYPNACIIDDVDLVVGIYMADGLNIEDRDYLHL